MKRLSNESMQTSVEVRGSTSNESIVQSEKVERSTSDIIQQKLKENARKQRMQSHDVQNVVSKSRVKSDLDGNGIPDKYEKGMNYASINRKINEIDELQSGMCFSQRMDVNDNMEADAMTSNITLGTMKQRAKNVVEQHEESHVKASTAIKAAMKLGDALLEMQPKIVDSGLPGDMFD